jgi:hypothetical protein
VLSRNKAAMLAKGTRAKPVDAVTPEEELKDPLVRELLGLKDEYSESELEEALILRFEHFLLEVSSCRCLGSCRCSFLLRLFRGVRLPSLRSSTILRG